MADIEYENHVVKETLAQFQGKMDLFQGNMEAVMEYLQAQKVTTSANLDVAVIVTNDVDVTTTIIDAATIKTPVDNVVQPVVSQPMFQVGPNRHVVSYPWGLPPNYASQFTNRSAFILYQPFDVPSLLGILLFRGARSRFSLLRWLMLATLRLLKIRFIILFG